MKHTHCRRGHPYDGNVDHAGNQRCRVCTQAKSRAAYAKRVGHAPRNYGNGHCSKGHPFDSQTPSGHNRCSTCYAEAGRRNYAGKVDARRAQGVLPRVERYPEAAERKTPEGRRAYFAQKQREHRARKAAEAAAA